MNRESMVIDRVDERDHTVGRVRRGDALAQGAGFRVVHVLLFDRRGRLLLQKLPSHARHPGAWGTSVAGYLLAGERYRDAARRKVAEELGVRELPLHYVGKTRMRDERSGKFIAIYTGTVDPAALRPNPEDFAGIDIVPVGRVAREIRAGARPCTPTFRHVLAFALPRLRS